jgi:CubicO group peptidase (beta-lactamase class C family)
MSSETKYACSYTAVLQPYVDRQELAGAVALTANQREVLSLDTVGYADIAGRKPMRENSLFWIASMSKPFTGTALMMLVDEGKVYVDDPVARYLPEFTGQWLVTEQDDAHQVLRQPAHPITVRNILTHTSGLPFSSAMETPHLDSLPLRVATQSYAMTALQFPPDSRYEYSNAGVNTAGRIIEVVSGIAYEEFLQQRLLSRLGLTDTTFWPNAEQLSRLAKSYRPAADGVSLEETPIAQLKYPLNDRASRFPMPAGGLFSTAHDVARFCQLVLNGGALDGKRYLSEAAVREMTRKQTGDAVLDGYGYGWATGGGIFGHGGAHATQMFIDPQRELITIYLVQHSGFPGEGEKSYAVFRKAAEEQREG